jgi:hypothetical protein
MWTDRSFQDPETMSFALFDGCDASQSLIIFAGISAEANEFGENEGRLVVGSRQSCGFEEL